MCVPEVARLSQRLKSRFFFKNCIFSPLENKNKKKSIDFSPWAANIMHLFLVFGPLCGAKSSYSNTNMVRCAKSELQLHYFSTYAYKLLQFGIEFQICLEISYCLKKLLRWLVAMQFQCQIPCFVVCTYVF